MKFIILASKSPRRRKLIKQLGVPFRVRISDADETTKLKRPSAIVISLALKKARAVACHYPDIAVIGADTIVVCGGRILGKPKNHKDALRLLNIQNGAWQKVYTGVAVVVKSKNFETSDYEISCCKARKLSPAELARLAGKHHDKAGAYAVQDAQDPFIEKITGPHDNVVGLPCALLAKLLAKAGVARERG